MKRSIFTALLLTFALLLVSCGTSGAFTMPGPDDESGSAGEDAVSDFDTDVPGYDPFAIVDYNEPLVDALSEGNVHIPKINVYLKGAAALSAKIMNDHKAVAEENDVAVSYECVVQYDTLQIIVRTANGGKESYKIYYYDALTDSELGMSDFMSYCSVAFKDMLAVASDAVGGGDLDEDAVEYFVYRGENSYDLYIEDRVYSVTIEKTQIDQNEIIDAVESENQ